MLSDAARGSGRGAVAQRPVGGGVQSASERTPRSADVGCNTRSWNPELLQPDASLCRRGLQHADRTPHMLLHRQRLQQGRRDRTRPWSLTRLPVERNTKTSRAQGEGFSQTKRILSRRCAEHARLLPKRASRKLTAGRTCPACKGWRWTAAIWAVSPEARTLSDNAVVPRSARAP
jgi:hypothetical protein